MKEKNRGKKNKYKKTLKIKKKLENKILKKNIDIKKLKNKFFENIDIKKNLENKKNDENNSN
jgi:hypothetical protein